MHIVHLQAPTRQVMHYWLQQLQQKRWEYSNTRGAAHRDSWSSPTLAFPPTGLVGKDNGKKKKKKTHTHSHFVPSLSLMCTSSVIQILCWIDETMRRAELLQELPTIRRVTVDGRGSGGNLSLTSSIKSLKLKGTQQKCLELCHNPPPVC